MNQGDSLIEEGIDLDYFPVLGKGLKGYLKSIRKLKSHIINNNFEIIHAHYGLCGIVSLFAKKGERLVVTFMGDDLIGTNRIDGSVTFKSRINVLINILLSRVAYDFCIVKSEEMYSKLKITHKSLIPNGINLNKFYPISINNTFVTLGFNGDNSKIVLFISDPLRPEKNYKLAKEAVDLISDIKVKLIPVFNIDNSELVHYYNAADVLLLTSFHEGSPNVIKEAMACNCPIVSTDVGDVKWIFGNVEGCYLSSFDPVDVSEKMKLAIEYREKYIQTKGRQRIIKLGLNAETVAERIIHVYRNILVNKGTCKS